MGGEASYLHELAEGIGPRPATTDTEAKAADYIEAVFAARGLPVERQEFETPRTYAWAYALYHLLTIASAVGAYFAQTRWSWAVWIAFALSALTALFLWRDLDTRRSLSSIMPKGPSQNVIARHVPKARRGERTLRVIVVAHYDSARASLAFSPGMVKNFWTTFRLMKWCTFAVPVLVLLCALPYTRDLQPWPWYLTLVPAAYLLVPLLINVHRELFMRPVDGANDNASGVAAMLGVMERVVPEPETDTGRFMTQPIRRTEEVAKEAEVVPEGALLSYSPAEAPHSPFEQDFATDEFTWGDLSAGEGEAAEGQGAFDIGDEEWAGGAESPEPAAQESDERRGVRDWLGVGKGFDARKEGRRIGSWDQFDEDEDDGWGVKGGSAEADFEDAGFAASEASRIRRRVTAGTDRALAEKEIWFVATGAEEVGTRGMLAFIAEYGEELRDSVIINIDNVGVGTVHWITKEGMARRYGCDRRLQSTARRVVSEEELPVRPREYKGLSTDATPALARRLRAMSVMAFDINGRLPNWHWRTDTVDNVDESTVVTAADFVTALIRAL